MSHTSKSFHNALPGSYSPPVGSEPDRLDEIDALLAYLQALHEDDAPAHTIQDEGSDLTHRNNLNFKGAAVVASDNPATGATDVTISAGAGSLPAGIRDAVTDYGFDGDGIADNTAAFNQALDDARNGDYNELWIPHPSNFYKVDDTIHFYGLNRFKIRGIGSVGEPSTGLVGVPIVYDGGESEAASFVFSRNRAIILQGVSFQSTVAQGNASRDWASILITDTQREQTVINFADLYTAYTAGTYATLYSATDTKKFYLWMDDGVVADPAPGGYDEGIAVDISGTPAAATIAANAQTAINAKAEFSAANVSGETTVRVSTAAMGATTASSDFNIVSGGAAAFTIRRRTVGNSFNASYATSQLKFEKCAFSLRGTDSIVADSLTMDITATNLTDKIKFEHCFWGQPDWSSDTHLAMDGSNTHAVHLDKCQVQFANLGIKQFNGSIWVNNTTMLVMGVCYHIENQTNPTAFRECNIEQCGVFSTSKTSFTNSRVIVVVRDMSIHNNTNVTYQTVAGSPFIDHRMPGIYSLENVEFDLTNNTSQKFQFLQSGGQTGVDVRVRGCIFGGAAAFSTTTPGEPPVATNQIRLHWDANQYLDGSSNSQPFECPGFNWSHWGMSKQAKEFADPTDNQDLATKAYVDAAGVTDHGALTGLSDDDHTQYPLSLGRLGGQTLIGGTGNFNALNLKATTGLFPGSINLGASSAFLEGANSLGLGTVAPATNRQLDILTAGSEAGIRTKAAGPQIGEMFTNTSGVFYGSQSAHKSFITAGSPSLSGICVEPTNRHVGIGENFSAPVRHLHLFDGADSFTSIRIENTSTAAADITLSADELFISNYNDHNLRLDTNSLTRVTIKGGTADAGGNVGLGTTTPADMLHLKRNNGTGDVAIRVQNNNTTASETASLALVTDTTDATTGGRIRSTRISSTNSRLSLWNRQAGTLTNALEIDENGDINFPNGTSLKWNSGTTVIRFSSLLRIHQDMYCDGNNLRSFGNGGTRWKRAYLGTDLDLDSCPITTELTTEDEAYINFKATADADTTSAISTLTTSGATTHHVQMKINGTKAWVAVSTNAPS